MPSLFDAPERFIRDSVVYDEFAYRVDHGNSALRGYFEKDNFWWTLHIECHAQEYPSDDEMRLPPQYAPKLDLTFPSGIGPASWREFELTTHSFRFDDDAAFPLMPGIPSGGYIGEHFSCTEHSLNFGTRIGNVLDLRWKPLAKFDEYDPGVFLYVDTDIPFTGVTVSVGNGKADLAAARKKVAKRFDLSEFQKPHTMRSQVQFELIPDFDDG